MRYAWEVIHGIDQEKLTEQDLFVKFNYGMWLHRRAQWREAKQEFEELWEHLPVIMKESANGNRLKRWIAYAQLKLGELQGGKDMAQNALVGFQNLSNPYNDETVPKWLWWEIAESHSILGWFNHDCIVQNPEQSDLFTRATLEAFEFAKQAREKSKAKQDLMEDLYALVVTYAMFPHDLHKAEAMLEQCEKIQEEVGVEYKPGPKARMLRGRGIYLTRLAQSKLDLHEKREYYTQALDAFTNALEKRILDVGKIHAQVANLRFLRAHVAQEAWEMVRLESIDLESEIALANGIWTETNCDPNSSWRKLPRELTASWNMSQQERAEFEVGLFNSQSGANYNHDDVEAVRQDDDL